MSAQDDVRKLLRQHGMQRVLAELVFSVRENAVGTGDRYLEELLSNLEQTLKVYKGRYDENGV